MKIKKYEASTETEAMLKVKEELGKDALIVSVKKIKPKGIYRIFRKPYVEVTAALDDKSMSDDSKPSINGGFSNNQETGARALNGTLENDNHDSFVRILRDLAGGHKGESPEKVVEMIDTSVSTDDQTTTDKPLNKEPHVKIVYEQLIENEVAEEYVNQLMAGLMETTGDNSDNIDQVVSVVYKRIAKLLGNVEPITLGEDKPKIVTFVGPTGVGKTTTIAKIASYYTLNKNKKVALITSDTYRIAAVEQLRTYANILDIPIKVVYTIDELINAAESFTDVDLILIDTAGRSHKNDEHINEVAKIINSIKDVSVYLVLSLSTKYKDLLKISESYNDISQYKLIFTKLDETSSYGNILNLKLKTNADLSYITYGQNVPDDFSEVDVYEIAKKTLGGCE